MVKIEECPSCKELKDTVKVRRTNTAYVKDELNFIEECAECFEQTEEYWRMMWCDFGR